MNKNQKSELVSYMKDTLSGNSFISVVHYRGMTDKQIYDMRTTLKAKGCNMKIAKNTLIKVAIKGTELEILTPYLSGPTAILYSQDVVALSKVLSETAKKIESLQIKVGYLNKSLVTESAIKDMAKLGSLDEVRASFIGILKGAQSNFVRILAAPEKGLASLKN